MSTSLIVFIEVTSIFFTVFCVIWNCTNAALVKCLSGYTFDSQCPWRIASIWAALSLSSPPTPPVNIYEIQHGPSVESRLQAAVWQDDRGSIVWKMDDNTKATLRVVKCPSLSSIIKHGEMGRPRRKWNLLTRDETTCPFYLAQYYYFFYIIVFNWGVCVK